MTMEQPEKTRQSRCGVLTGSLAGAVSLWVQCLEMQIVRWETHFRVGQLSLEWLLNDSQQYVLEEMELLAKLVDKVETYSITGGALINLLYHEERLVAREGRTEAALVAKLLRAVMAAYQQLLCRWLEAGALEEDVDNEFMVERVGREPEAEVPDEMIWEWSEGFRVRQPVPEFLRGMEQEILATGKYVLLMAESKGGGRDRGAPLAVGDVWTHKYPKAKEALLRLQQQEPNCRECIRTVFDAAAHEVLQMFNSQFELQVKMRLLKKFFLLELGDVFCTFIGTMSSLLHKKREEVELKLLEVELDASIASSSIGRALESTESLKCQLDSVSVWRQLEQQLGAEGSEKQQLTDTRSLTVLESFSLGMQVHWPLSLLLSAPVIRRYQNLFRVLFHLKVCMHSLDHTFLRLQKLHKEIRRHESYVVTAIKWRSVVCSHMLMFIRCLLSFIQLRVIEPNWSQLEMKLLSAKSLEEVMLQHEHFLDVCMQGAMAAHPSLCKGLEAICRWSLRFSHLVMGEVAPAGSQGLSALTLLLPSTAMKPMSSSTATPGGVPGIASAGLWEAYVEFEGAKKELVAEVESNSLLLLQPFVQLLFMSNLGDRSDEFS